MLRLRPSELTLTADDIDDTLRRIARTQAARTTHNIASYHTDSTGRPVLRRGPQRAAQEAITSLGNIPILRPQSQHVVHTSLDEDIERPSEERRPSPQTDIHTDSETSIQEEPRAASTPTAVSRILQLPFRLGQSRRDSATLSSSEDQVAEPGAATTTPRIDRIATGIRGSSKSHQKHQSSPSCSRKSMGSPAELRGGGRAIKFCPVTSSDEFKSDFSSDASLDPPPVSRRSHDAKTPMLCIRGRFADVARDPLGSEYVFDEHWYLPQTEPRRPSRQHDTLVRSLSSGSTPRNQLSAPRPRVSSSEASNDSAPYSFYELPPESRQSSGNYNLTVPGQDQVDPHSQLPQMFPSRAASAQLNSQPQDYQPPMGPPPGYGNRTVSNCHGHPQLNAIRGSRYVNIQPRMTDDPQYYPMQPNSLHSTQYGPGVGAPAGMSPLPTTPYHVGAPSGPDPPAENCIDAAAEAVRNLPSPLETFAEHYERLWNLPGNMTPGPLRQPQPGFHRFTPLRGTFEGSASGTRTDAPSYNEAAEAHRLYTSRRFNQRLSDIARAHSPGFVGSHAQQSQVQTHREAYERLQNAQRAMQTQAPPPRNSPHTNTPHASPNSIPTNSIHTNPTPTTPLPGSQTLQPPPPQQVPPISSLSPFSSSPTPPPHFPLYPPRRNHPPVPRDYNRPMRPPPQLHPPLMRSSYPHRPLPLSVPSRTHRRVPYEQRDQENSGSAEEQLVREEVVASQARYNEEARGDTMDETPPAMGKIERRMFD